VLATFCWKKSFLCKDIENMDSTYQSIFRRLCTAKKIEEFKFPISSPDDRAISSGRPSVNRSSCPDDVPYRPNARQTSIIRPDDVFLPSGPYTVSRSFCASLHTSGRLSSPSGRPSVIDQFQILSKFKIREDRYIRPDDVGIPSGRVSP
jgi:hypothetical protein